MSVWKVGSRWHEFGDYNCSILSIFRRNSVVFVGNKTERFINQVKKGDYFVIADGRKAVAVARALTDGELLNNIIDKLERYSREEKAIFDFEECKDFAAGCKVRIHDLEEPFEIYAPGSFCNAGYLSSKVIDCYEQLNKRFSISSSTYTLLRSDSSPDRSILGDNGNTNFVVPIYQRAYSWTESQINQFIDELFLGYWGSDYSFDSQEQIFIGTMQFSKKKGIGRDFYEQEIIDGQQRLSTILLLLKVLALKFPSIREMINCLLGDFSFETRVAWPEQQNFFLIFMGKENLEDLDGTRSLYETNGILINGLLDNHVAANPDLFSPESFFSYITHQIVFVVIETFAGLSKTLQIFNTINTAGLDLSAGDLFKLNLFEYLKNKGANESVFTEIDSIYSLIDSKNSEYKKDNLRFSIDDVLSVYKDYLVSKYELGSEPFNMATSTFYSRLFDTLLGVKDWEGFKTRTLDVDISISELKEIVCVLFEWEKSKKIAYDYPRMFGDNIFWFTRYAKYYWIAYQLLWRYRDVSFVLDVISQLSKLFIIFSICYAKQVNEIHSFMYNIEVAINKRAISEDEILSMVNLKIEEFFKDRLDTLFNTVGSDISYYPRIKNLLCLIDEYLFETENAQPKEVDDLMRTLFWTGFDIEHIHATEDSSIEVEERLQNSIGNLTLLESSINRSISNKPFKEKKIQYADSIFSFINSLSSLEKWGVEEIELRKERVSEKIINYLKSH